MTSPAACRWCGSPAGRFCDGPTAEPGRTCDAPLCRRRAVWVGAFHVHARPWTPGLSG